MVTLLAPLHEELKGLRPYLVDDTTVHWRPATIWHGRIGTQEVILARCGVGQRAMRRAADFCLRHLRSTELLLIGFGGATAPHLHVGDLVVGSTIVDSGSGTHWEPPPALRERACAIARDCALPAETGPIVTVAAPAPSPHEKAFLGTQHAAIAVDMEASALAAVAAAAGSPWLVVRSIFDTMDMTFPEGLAATVEDGTTAYGKLCAHLCRHPRDTGHLARLYFAAAKAREALTKFAKAWVAGQ